jgi:hypothetical protein
VAPDLTVARAHEIARAVEERVRASVGGWRPRLRSPRPRRGLRSRLILTRDRPPSPALRAELPSRLAIHRTPGNSGRRRTRSRR